MNDAQKNARVEMEIKSHEKEMMRKARLKKLQNASLKEKIDFIISDTNKSDWKAHEMMEELQLNGLLDATIKEEDVAQALNHPSGGSEKKSPE